MILNYGCEIVYNLHVKRFGSGKIWVLNEVISSRLSKSISHPASCCTKMNEKGTQVAIGSKKVVQSSCSTQTPGEAPKKDQATQSGLGKGSYARDERKADRKWRYDVLIVKLHDKDRLIDWLMEEGLLAKSRICSVCGDDLKLVYCEDRSDGLKWECRRRVDGKRHKVEMSIRAGSWFAQSKMTLEEILKYSYWWTQELDQAQIRHELGLATHTGVDWDSFCREVCEISLMEDSESIGGEGKVVQIDESKFGKRKYHRGHHVEGQWVFGGIENDSRKCFLIAVEKRDEQTLLPIIKKWIKPGTTIISDCWKAYCNLEKHGYTHRTVNHSIEFVNDEGDSTNKMEGHWRHAKVKMPPFGVRKHHFSSYLAEFMWRYRNKDNDLFEMFLRDVKKIYPVN